MKESLIQTDVPIEECTAFLGKVFHCGVTDNAVNGGTDFNEDQEPGEERKDCHSTHGGLCRCTQHLDAIKKYVRIFNDYLKAKELQTGALLFFSSGSESFAGLLGVCMQRPHLHVILKVDINDSTDTVVFFNPDFPKKIEMLTSHHLFQQLISDPKECVTVEAWEYQVSLQESGLVIHALQSLDGKQGTLDITARVSSKKPRPKLLFGLKPRSKKKRAINKKRKGTRPRGSKPLGQNELSSDKSVDTFADPSASDSMSDGKEGEQIEDEDLYVLTSQAASEEKEASTLIEQHEGFKALRETTHAVPETGVSSGASSSSRPLPDRDHVASFSKSTSKPGPKSSFFATKLGFDDVGVAASARSKCYFCTSPIEKGHIRFCYFHSTKRPSAWVHAGCVSHLAARDGLKTETKEKLEDLLQKPRAGMCAEEATKISNALKEVLAAMRAQ